MYNRVTIVVPTCGFQLFGPSLDILELERKWESVSRNRVLLEYHKRRGPFVGGLKDFLRKGVIYR